MTLNAESTAVQWLPVADLSAFPLHPGFAATLPAVLGQVPSTDRERAELHAALFGFTPCHRIE